MNQLTPRSGVVKAICMEPGCPNPAEWRGRCSWHRRVNERGTSRAGYRVYRTKRWRMLRKRKLFLTPVCERCNDQLATEVHHTEPVREGQNPYRLELLEALCKGCHSRETRREQLEGEKGRV